MRHRLETRIDIDTTPERVWAVLTDLESYQQWNPFIVSAAGEVTVGAKLRNRMQPPDARAVSFTPTVTVADGPRKLEWLGRLGVPGIFDGRHRFELEPTSTGTRLIQSEDFTGVMVRPMLGYLDGKTVRGFEAMNQALKARAEQS